MDKSEVLGKVCEHVKASLETLKQAANAAHDAATHPESQAEDKYDTRGLEASYLAGAQSRRAMELERLLTQLQYLELQSFAESSPILATALVEVDDGNARQIYFLLPEGGGISVVSEGRKIHVVTPQSPVGSALLRKRVGDEVDVDIGGKARCLEILGVW